MEDQNRNDILNKALKLKVASERGDEHIRDFAKQKYNEFLMDNLLEDAEVLRYQRADIRPAKQKTVTVNGRVFHSMDEFVKYYDTLSFKQKIIVFCQILKNDGYKKTKTT